MGRNGQLAMEGAAALGVSRRPDLPQRRQLRPVQLLPLRLRDRRQARHARQLPAPCGGGRGADAGRGRGAPAPGRGRPRGRSRSAWRRRGSQRRRAAPLHGPRPPRDDRRRRRARHAGAAAALRARRRPGRPQPPHPPRLLGRRPLRGGGARLGGRDAELLRGRVGGASGSCSRRPSPRSPSAAAGCRAPAAPTRKRCSTSATSPRSASSSPTAPAAGSASPRDGSLKTHLPADRARTPGARSSASPAPPKSTSPPAPPRSTPTSRGAGVLRPGELADFEATAFKPSELRLEAFHPRARRGSQPTPARASATRAAPSAASATSTSPTPRSSRARSTSTR